AGYAPLHRPPTASTPTPAAGNRSSATPPRHRTRRAPRRTRAKPSTRSADSGRNRPPGGLPANRRRSFPPGQADTRAKSPHATPHGAPSTGQGASGVWVQSLKQLLHKLGHSRHGDPAVLPQDLLHLCNLLSVEQSTQRRDEIVVLQRLDHLEIIQRRQVNCQLQVPNRDRPLRVVLLGLLRLPILRSLDLLHVNVSHYAVSFHGFTLRDGDLATPAHASAEEAARVTAETGRLPKIN